MSYIMKRWIGFFCILIFASMLQAFDYRVRTIKILPPGSYPARATVEGVTIAADPYSTNRKSFTAFDVKNLNWRGYFPIHIIIWNNSSLYLTIRTRNVLLITSSAQQLYTTPAAVLVDDVFKDGLDERPPEIKELQDPLSLAKSGSALSDFSSKELANRLVEPGTVADGFIFFFTEAPKKNLFAGSTLFIPKLEEEGTHKAMGPFSIPLDPALPKIK